MKTKLLSIAALVVLFFVSSWSSTRPPGGNDKIESVKIGSQVWSAKNLNVEHFRNGDPISYAKSKRKWRQAAATGTPAWCYYGFDPMNGEKYGKLYNWYALVDPRGLAPEGWHVPTDDEWMLLMDTLGGLSGAGNLLKSKSGWKTNTSANNKSGFNALPGGYRDTDGLFNFQGDYGKFWTVSSSNSRTAWSYFLYHGYAMSVRYMMNKGAGLSVRCVKD